MEPKQKLNALIKKAAPVYKGDNPFTVTTLEYPPDFEADEATIRAREAVISTGVFMGSEEMIRAGLLDHTHGIQSALELQRSADVPLQALVLRPHGPVRKKLIPTSIVQFQPAETGFFHWLVRLQHRFARTWTRYARVQAQHKKQIETLDHIITTNNETTNELLALTKKQAREIQDAEYKLRTMGTELKLAKHYNQKKADIAVHEMLASCDDEEERAALASLLRRAVIQRDLDPETKQVRLSVNVNRSVTHSEKTPRDGKCQCGRIFPITASTSRHRCEPCEAHHRQCDALEFQRRHKEAVAKLRPNAQMFRK